MTLYHYECRVCEYDDTEGPLAAEYETLCGLCASDSGRERKLARWPAIEGLTRSEAREVHREQKGRA